MKSFIKNVTSLFRYFFSLCFAVPLLAGIAYAQDRVVSIGGDITEIAFALGAGDKIVAADSTSVYPAEANDIPKVGYLRQLAAEGVLSVEPDLILISGAAGPESALAQIRASGVPVIEMPTEYTIESIVDKTRQTAKALGKIDEGAALVEQIEQDWEEAKEAIEALDSKPKVLFVAATQDGAARAAGQATAAHGVIELMGGKNLFDEFSGYKNLSLESAVAADPDIILMMGYQAARFGGREAVNEHPALSLTRAAQNGDVYFVDRVEVMQFSPRTPKAIASLAREIAVARSKTN